MPGKYKVAYVYQDYLGVAVYIYEGHRDDHYGNYERRLYRGATTMEDVFSANYEVGQPYVLDEYGFYQAPTATTSWWRRLQDWLRGGAGR